jgi:Glycosyl transferase family 2
VRAERVASVGRPAGAGYPSAVPRQRIPDDVLSLAHDRAAARLARNWVDADRIRAEIEAAGWTIVDRGTDFALSPAHPRTEEDGAVVRFGSSTAVPSLLDAPPTGLATVVLVATDWPDDLDRALGAIRRHGPAGMSLVIVADGVPADAEERLPATDEGLEVIRTSERLGTATAWNIGIRRASGPIVVVLDSSVEATGDIVSPLAAALEDPTVAVAGGFGIVSDDLRRFADGGPGEVTAIEGYALAFRRSDAAARGPLDERFRFYRNLDIWWSLVLRDAGEDIEPRRALAVPIPAVRHEHRGWTALDPAERDRLSKRNFYRIIDRFGARRDLTTG